MPIRKSKPKSTYSLNELLNWVAHDDFSGPYLSPSEVSAAVFGVAENVEEIEIAQFTRVQAEDAARNDIIDALSNGEIDAKGHHSDQATTVSSDWRRDQYRKHALALTAVPAAAWQQGEIDWENSSLKTPSGEYIKIRFDRDDVLRVWESPEESGGETDHESYLTSSSERMDSNVPRYRDFKNSLLVALAQEDANDSSSFHDLKIVADKYSFKYRGGWVNKAAYDFRDSGFIQESFHMSEDEDGGLSCKLTGSGLEAAEELMEELGTDFASPRESQFAPASDRIVKRSDNEDAWINAIDGAKELHDALVASNDHSDLSEDEFEQKLSEVRALQILLDAPQVQWEALDRFAKKTVKYLAIKFADNAIGIAAGGLLGYLIALLKGAF